MHPSDFSAAAYLTRLEFKPRSFVTSEFTWPVNNSDKYGVMKPCSLVCGLKNGDDRPLLGVQIAGGEPSNPHEWPWLVFINIGFRANVAASGGTCGGALISPE